MIPRRMIVRLVGATVAGLTLLTGAPPTAGALTSTGPVQGAGASAAVRPLAAAGTGLELKLTKVTPAATGPDDEVVISGTVRNLGTTAVKTTRISLWLRSEVLADRESIKTWLSKGSLTQQDRQLPGTAVVRALASGASSSFRIEVPPGDTGLLSSSEFGPRAIALQARSGGRRLATLRSTLVWAPTEISTPTRLSVIVPITSSTPTTHAGEPSEGMAADLLPGGRLQHVVAAAHDPSMAWAVDPAILTAAQRLISDGVDQTPDDADLADPDSEDPDATDSATAGSTTPSTSTTAAVDDRAAKTGSEAWLTLFKSESAGRGLFGLPYADPDLTSVLRSRKGVPLLQSSDTLGQAASAKVLGRSLDNTLAWPADGRINAATTRSLVQLKRTTVILAGRAQKPDPPVALTPTGRSTVRSSAGSLTSLLYDEQLSGLLSSASTRTPADTQTLLAQLAAITREDPGSGRHLLAVTPRTWNPDPSAVRTMMNALGSAPWISLRGISELQDTNGPARAAPIYRRADAKAELPPGNISSAQVLDKGLTTFAPVLQDPAPVEPLRERIASLLSVSWRQDRRELVPARIDVSDNVNKLVGGVKLGVSKTYRFTARKTNFPVTVTNDTNYPVTVMVRLKPQSGQLKFPQAKTVTVEANKRLQILLQAEALASGDVVVEGKLYTTDNKAIAPGTTFLVRVRPDWESWGMIGVGSILGFLLVIGLLRGLRRNRGRTRVPIEAVPDIDEQATRRAAENGAGDHGSNDSERPKSPGPPEGSPGSARSEVGTEARPFAGTTTVLESARPVFPGPNPEPGRAPNPVPSTLPTAPVPVPLSKPDPEPDPKVLGGPVDSDGVRPPVKKPVRRAGR